MTTRSASANLPHLEWRRVGAFSTSVSAHLAVAALLLMPLTPPLQSSLEHVIDVSFIKPPPPPPQPVPAEPQPLRKPPSTRVAAPPPPRPAPVAASETTSPVTPPPAAVPVAPTTTDIAPPAPTTAPAGATRRLGYDGELRLRYPAASLRLHEQGVVLLRVLVDTEGRAERVEIERSSGYPKLDQAARAAALRGRFKPVLQDGRAAPAWGLLPVEFRLDRA